MQAHREHQPANQVQLSTLLSIKTGGCPEDCGYCPQAARYDTGVTSQALLPLAEVVAAARAAKASGATRFCMGAAWRGPKERDLEPVLDMVREVKALGMETCATLGMLKDGQAEGSRMPAWISTTTISIPRRNFTARSSAPASIRTASTLSRACSSASVSVCCGGIVGMGETRRVRAGLIAQLANLDPQPESVPINNLVQVEGTPLFGTAALDPLEFVRTIAARAHHHAARAMVRLSAGRQQMGEA